MAQPTPQHIKDAIVQESLQLKGTMTGKATILAKKYNLSVKYVSDLIRHTIPKVNRKLTDEERERVKKLLAEQPGDVVHYKCRNVAEIMGISHNTVYLISKEKTKFFNPKMQMF